MIDATAITLAVAYAAAFVFSSTRSRRALLPIYFTLCMFLQIADIILAHHGITTWRLVQVWDLAMLTLLLPAVSQRVGTLAKLAITAASVLLVASLFCGSNPWSAHMSTCVALLVCLGDDWVDYVLGLALFVDVLLFGVPTHAWKCISPDLLWSGRNVCWIVAVVCLSLRSKAPLERGER